MKLRAIKLEDVVVTNKACGFGRRIHISLRGVSFISHTAYFKNDLWQNTEAQRMVLLLELNRQAARVLSRLEHYIEQ